MSRRRRALAGLALAVVALTACEVRTDVAVDVGADGSGVVSVGVALDDDALRRVPGIADELRFDDLTATGWEVQRPTREDDGLTWIRVRKPFATPEEADDVLTELTGGSGPMRDFSVTRERSFGRTVYRFAATVDLTGGLESFGDEALAQALDGEPLGEDVAAIEARLGQPIDDVFTFRVAVRLPGDVESNAPTDAGDLAVWEPSLADTAPTELTASSEVLRWRTYGFVGLALVAGGAAVVVAILGLHRSPRSRN